MPVIRIENLSKSYRIQHGAARSGYRTLRETLADLAAAPLRRLRGSGNGKVEDFWALKDVNLEVQQGEVVGIIGRNGAGKSTLLKILSRITAPTAGRVELHGRVGSLLEVGTGFHPELTGRENIYLNGSILGMSGREIQKKFDEIVEFSGVERFLDTPVKRYSSGMYVRLAFAVAAHLEPEILFVDEVLAVGDFEFQQRCLGKMREVATHGRTVLFVSHNMAAVQNLCPTTVVLEKGSVAYMGPTSMAVAHYMASGRTVDEGEVDLRGHPNRRRGCESVLEGIRFLDNQGRCKARFAAGEPIIIEFTCDLAATLVYPQFGIGFEDCHGSRVFSVATYLSTSKLPELGGRCRVRCSISELALTPGRYWLSLSAGTAGNPLVDALDEAVALEIEGGDFFGNGKIPSTALGRVLVRSDWAVAEAC